MYFTNFPKIYYDFPQDATSTSLQILTDITTNVRIRKQVLENITLYDEYDMKEGETPEIVAEKVYGDPELHWVIMLVNERYDYLKDFPMSSLELEQHTINKYGADNLDDVHHYELNGIITEAKAVIKIPKLITPLLKVHDYINGLPKANARIESIDKINNTASLLIDFGRFASGQLVSATGVRPVTVYNTETKLDVPTGEIQYRTIANFNIPIDGFIINDKYSIITNSEYEIKINESKRTIKLISSKLVDQIINEFQLLVA
jgi:hypothetical protein